MSRQASGAPIDRALPEGPPLRVESLRKNFGDLAALDRISLEVGTGECLALVGESGSGKTTLLRCVNRLVEPDEGRVLMDSRDVRTLDPVALRRGIGYVPQDGGLLPHWRVARNVQLVPRLLNRPQAARDADEAMRLVGLEPGVFGDRWPRELSGGQRQRVALARALAASPRVLLLDEPFGALDAITRAELQQTFGRLRQEGTGARFTALLVTHDLREAFLLADRIAVLRRGRLEQAAAPAELLAHPETPYVRALLERARVTRADLAAQPARSRDVQ